MIYAGFWRRFAAVLIDSLWLIPCEGLLFYLKYGNGLEGNLGAPWEWLSLLISIPFLINLWYWVRYAATPGKLLFDCDIVDAKTGQRMTFLQALLRSFGYLLSLLLLGLGFLWILRDKRKQGWHDKIAGTVVIMHDEASIPLEQLLAER